MSKSKADCLRAIRDLLTKDPSTNDVPPLACIEGAIVFIENFIDAPHAVAADSDSIMVENEEGDVMRTWEFFDDGTMEFVRFEGHECVICLHFDNPLYYDKARADAAAEEGGE